MGELAWASFGHYILEDIRFLSSQSEKFAVRKDPRVLTGSWMYFISHFCNKSSFQSPEITTILLQTFADLCRSPAEGRQCCLQTPQQFSCLYKGMRPSQFWLRTVLLQPHGPGEHKNVFVLFLLGEEKKQKLQSVFFSFFFCFLARRITKKHPVMSKCSVQYSFCVMRIISPPLIMLM